jgi:hypothetical protein
MALASGQATAIADSGATTQESSSETAGPRERPDSSEPAQTSARAAAEDDGADAAPKRKRRSDISDRTSSASEDDPATTRRPPTQRRPDDDGAVPLAVKQRPSRVPAPTADDMAETPYGDLGKWMVKADGRIADWLGHEYEGRNLLEPVNIVIVDRTSTTPEQSEEKVNATLSAAGFPAMGLHSTGLRGVINGVLYGQEPDGPYEAFSNCFFLFPNDHARLFGPAPVPDGVGFVWTVAASREIFGIYDLSFTHLYVSFNTSRNMLRDSLVHSGATDLGMVYLDNDVDNRAQNTGDHDGYAAVIELGSPPRRRLSA